MFAKSLIVAAASLMMVNAASIAVDVGKGGITFTPNTATAAKGDVLVFTFDSGPHSVTQGTFATPCQPLAGGFDSGLLSTGTFSVTVNDTNPIWVHCSVASHCSAGMVFAVNAPTTGNTFTTYQSIAEGKASASAAASSGAASATAAASAGAATASAAVASSTSKSSASAVGLDMKAWMAAAVGVVGAAAGALLV